jgi:hypothetical protein
VGRILKKYIEISPLIDYNVIAAVFYMDFCYNKVYFKDKMYFLIKKIITEEVIYVKA